MLFRSLEDEQRQSVVALGPRDLRVRCARFGQEGLQLAIHTGIVIANLRPMAHLPHPSARTRRVLLLGGGAVAVLVTLVFLASAAERRLWSGRVLPGVEVAGIDLSGRSESRTRTDVADIARRIEQAPVHGRTGKRTFTLDPGLVATTVDTEATTRAALAAGRGGNPVAEAFGTLLRRFRPDRVTPMATFDRTRLEGALDAWGRSLAGSLVEGNLRFDGARVVAVEPRAGDGLRRDAAQRRLLAALLGTGPARDIDLPVGRIEPELDAAAVTAAADRARRLLSGPVEVVAGDRRISLAPATLAGLLGTKVAGRRLDLTLDRRALRAAVTPVLAGFETPPQEAGFSVNRDGTVTVVASRSGRVADLTSTATAILAGERVVEVGRRDERPAHDTTWARSLGITRQVATFTTHHLAGQPRVTNIHTGADALDGAVVEPGATFSLNERLGPRTPEKGYVKAPILVNDGYGEDYGGGVSQIATTLFNAVFFGGYEDVEHAPHRFYISRYPMGREDRKSTRLNSSHVSESRMPSSA